jgi:hypothetical protein
MYVCTHAPWSSAPRLAQQPSTLTSTLAFGSTPFSYIPEKSAKSSPHLEAHAYALTMALHVATGCSGMPSNMARASSTRPALVSATITLLHATASNSGHCPNSASASSARPHKSWRCAQVVALRTYKSWPRRCFGGNSEYVVFVFQVKEKGNGEYVQERRLNTYVVRG